VEEIIAPRDHLTRARLALAERKVEEARREVDLALNVPLSRADDAEARTLLAECAIADGDRETGGRLLREVASEFTDLIAGENALFAAARLASDGADRVSARRLFQQYLDRYPHGRFESEVRWRLRSLDDRK
jgi:hypothetical protein